MEILGFPRKRRRWALDELNDEELSEAAMIAPIVRLMRHGSKAREALQAVGLPVTEASRRWAQRAYKRYREHGVSHDRRHDIEHVPTVLTSEMRDIIVDFWRARPGAHARGILHMIRDEAKRRERAAAVHGEALLLRIPALPTLRSFLQTFPKTAKIERDVGAAAWSKLARPVGVYDPAKYANHYWQIDHTMLDIVVRILAGVSWVPVRPWLTIVLDVFSRAVMGLVISLRPPDAFTTAYALRHAISPKEDGSVSQRGWPARGKPVFLTPDHGKDFESTSIGISVQSLGITLDWCPPHYPDMKAEIERWFGTMSRELLALYPGYKPSDGRSDGAVRKRLHQLLTVKQLRRIMEQWIVEEYHARVHSETRRRPIELWEESSSVDAVGPGELDVLLLKADETRVVSNRGVRFTPDGGSRMVYWAPELIPYWRHEVRIRYHPDDLESILVYEAATDQRICEAWRIDVPDARYGIDDVKRGRAELAAKLTGLRRRGRRALEVRMQDLWAEAAAEARAARRIAGTLWAEARADAETLQRVPIAAEPSSDTSLDGDAREVLRELRTASPLATPALTADGPQVALASVESVPTPALAPAVSGSGKTQVGCSGEEEGEVDAILTALRRRTTR